MTLTEIYKELEPYIIRLHSTPEELEAWKVEKGLIKAELQSKVDEIVGHLTVLGMTEEVAKENLAILVAALNSYVGSVPVPPPPPPPPVDGQTAFGGTPWSVGTTDATVFASNFDVGGPGIAYNDDAGRANANQVLRLDSDVEVNGSTPEDSSVGWVRDGEWLEYTINVAAAGEYKLILSTSTPNNGRTITASFEQDGVVYATTAGIASPNTGSYTNFANTTPEVVNLRAGVQVVRLTFGGGNDQDIKSFTITPSALAPPVDPPPVGDLSSPGDFITSSGSLVTLDGVWTIVDGKIHLNGTALAETAHVTRLEVVQVPGNVNKLTVMQTISLGGLRWYYDPTNPLALNGRWVDVAATGPIDPPVSPPPPPPPPPATGWVPFAPIDGLVYPDQFNENRWGYQFGVSNWQEGKFANGPWKYDHVVKNGDGTVTLKANPSGNGQIQHHNGYTSNARVGALVTFGAIRPDSITTPVWMFSNYAEGNDGSGRFELDFEVAGRKELQVNYHDGIRPGKLAARIPGDFSNRTVRFEIDFDRYAGYADFIVDGVVVKRITKAEVEGWGMKWPIRGMFPIYDLWLVNNPGWTGAPYNPNDATTMEVILRERLFNRRD